MAQIFAAPKDDYTKALIACRPSLEGNPARLMVIDDHIAGRAAQQTAKPKDPQAPVVLGRQRIVGNAQPTTETLAWQAIAQHHRQRQRQTVRAQLHRLPACCNAI